MTITPEERTAPTGVEEAAGRVTLMNRFVVAPERDDDFHAAWYETSRYFVVQPGFISLRLHRAVNDEASHRWVNVAVWESEQAFRAAHATDDFRRLVSQEKWEEFPSEPVLFQTVVAEGEMP
jgi:heme-degrading monooxygenase HmoA